MVSAGVRVVCVGYFVLVNFLFIATAGAFGCTGHRLLVDQHTVNSLIFSAICAWWGFPSRLTNPYVPSAQGPGCRSRRFLSEMAGNSNGIAGVATSGCCCTARCSGGCAEKAGETTAGNGSLTLYRMFCCPEAYENLHRYARCNANVRLPALFVRRARMMTP